MANSKDVSQGQKSFMKLFRWGLVLAILAMLCILVWSGIPKFRSHPNSAAQASLRNLLTVLEAYYADHQKYPQPDKVTSFRPEDGVTVFHIVTSRDEQNYFAMAFNTKEGDRLYVASSDRSIIWWIPFPKEGLVAARSL